MTDVMLKMITICFQSIIVFVFNLPPRPPRSTHLCHIAIVNCRGGSGCIPAHNLAVFRARGNFALIYEQRITVLTTPLRSRSSTHSYKVLCESGLQTRINSKRLSSSARQKGS